MADDRSRSWVSIRPEFAPPPCFMGHPQKWMSWRKFSALARVPARRSCSFSIVLICSKNIPALPEQARDFSAIGVDLVVAHLGHREERRSQHRIRALRRPGARTDNSAGARRSLCLWLSLRLAEHGDVQAPREREIEAGDSRDGTTVPMQSPRGRRLFLRRMRGGLPRRWSQSRTPLR